MKRLIIFSLILLILLFSGCNEQQANDIRAKYGQEIKNEIKQTVKEAINETGNVSNEIVCNPPYIRFASSCCLDKNSNNICDSDETPEVIPPNDTTPPTNEQPIEAGIIVIGDTTSQPVDVKINVGESVTFKNTAENRPHLIIVDELGQRSTRLESGNTFTFTFDKAGTYTYRDLWIGSIRGTIIVGSGNEEETPVVKDIDADVQKLFDKANTLTNYNYDFTAPKNDFVAKVSVLNNNMKIFFESGPQVYMGYKYDTIYFDTVKKTAVAMCTSLNDCDKITTTQEDYDRVYVKTMLDIINVVVSAKVTGEEMLDNRNCNVIDYNLSDGETGKMWIDKFYGVPLKRLFTLDGEQVSATYFSFSKDSTNQADFEMPVSPTEPPASEQPIVEAGIIILGDRNSQPVNMTINIGESVTFKNTAGREHLIIVDELGQRSSRLELGNTFTFTFDKAGTYTYRDLWVGSLRGTITVER